MATSQEYIEHIMDILSPVGFIEYSRMFGGVLLKVEGKQLGVILLDTLYFKVVDSQLQEKWRAMESEQFTYTRKDKTKPVVIKNWWQVPDAFMDDELGLVSLAQEVLEQEY